MPENLKVLGQRDPAAATLETTYTVPTDGNAVVSTITVANRSASPTAFRISVAPGGVANDNEHYLYYDIVIEGNDTFAATLGITLEEDDEVRVYATLATLSFSIFGSEIT